MARGEASSAVEELLDAILADLVDDVSKDEEDAEVAAVCRDLADGVVAFSETAESNRTQECAEVRPEESGAHIEVACSQPQGAGGRVSETSKDEATNAAREKGTSTEQVMLPVVEANERVDSANMPPQPPTLQSTEELQQRTAGLAALGHTQATQSGVEASTPEHRGCTTSRVAELLSSASVAQSKVLHALEEVGDEYVQEDAHALGKAATAWLAQAARLKRHFQALGVLPDNDWWDTADRRHAQEGNALVRAAHASLERELELRSELEAARAEVSAARGQLGVLREREHAAVQRLRDMESRAEQAEDEARAARKREAETSQELVETRRLYAEELSVMMSNSASKATAPSAPMPVTVERPQSASQTIPTMYAGDHGDFRTEFDTKHLPRLEDTMRHSQSIHRRFFHPLKPFERVAGLTDLTSRIDALEASLLARIRYLVPDSNPIGEQMQAVQQTQTNPHPPIRKRTADVRAASAGTTTRKGMQTPTSPIPTSDNNSSTLPSLAHAPSMSNSVLKPTKGYSAPSPNHMDENHLREARVKYFKERIALEHRMRTLQRQEAWS